MKCQFEVIMNVETNLSSYELACLLSEKLPELVHHVYKADENSDYVVSLESEVKSLTPIGVDKG